MDRPCFVHEHPWHINVPKSHFYELILYDTHPHTIIKLYAKYQFCAIRTTGNRDVYSWIVHVSSMVYTRPTLLPIPPCCLTRSLSSHGHPVITSTLFSNPVPSSRGLFHCKRFVIHVVVFNVMTLCCVSSGGEPLLEGPTGVEGGRDSPHGGRCLTAREPENTNDAGVFLITSIGTGLILIMIFNLRALAYSSSC